MAISLAARQHPLKTNEMALKQLFLNVCWGVGLFHVTRFLTRKKLNILCYHGFQLRDECAFRPKLFISRETFTQRLSFIRDQGFSVLPLGDALDRLQAGTLPPSSVAITIDDGFHSVASVAAGLLKTHQFPATLYLTTYYVQKASPIFRLAVQYVFWKTQKHEFVCNGLSWLCSGSTDLRNEGAREKLMWAIIDHGEQNCDEDQRVNITKVLGDLLAVDVQALEDSRTLSLMTPDEVRQFELAGFDVELHTHRHRFPADDELAARKEIAENREAIRAILGKEARHFCYPSGHWDKKQWPWLQDLRVASATTCLPGFNTRVTPLYGLTRFLDSEHISQIEFVAEMYGFLEVARSIRKFLKGHRSLPNQA